MRCPRCGSTVLEPPHCSIAVEHECAICDWRILRPGYTAGNYNGNPKRWDTRIIVPPKCLVTTCHRQSHGHNLCEDHESYWFAAGKPDIDLFIQQLAAGIIPDGIRKAFNMAG